ncbi:putative dual-specificity RNA methyltransferase RlmN [Spirochaetia bacterium]|nr:putative dual-specificity RNA methyltransferase RlmN [Spirochaetia bacterium]
MPVLCGLPLAELTQALAPLPRFRAVQIFKWIARGVLSFDLMSDLPLSLREELKGRFTVCSSVVAERHIDNDGTVKLGIDLANSARIEAVLLADAGERRTACLSTQAGCPAGCVFCKTGSLGFMRNLNPAEIVEQFLFLREAAGGSIAGGSIANGSIANIVIMGMGEPLLNLAELRRALAVISDPQGMNFSKRRITLSTCGISEGIIDLADKGPNLCLALSLTTACEEKRKRLMPVTTTQPLARVKEALAYFQCKGGGRITLEAVLLGGINTTSEDAAALAEFARGLDTVVNLIPWNPVQGLVFEGKALKEPSAREVESFTRQLEELGLKVTRRYRKGRGVMGACGQLGQLSPT